MKKLVVLMSVSLMALGSYSFSIAMQEDYGFSSQDGTLYDEAEKLSLEEVCQKKLEKINTQRDTEREEAEEIEQVMRKMRGLVLPSVDENFDEGRKQRLNAQIIKHGNQNRGGEVISDDLRVLDEKVAADQYGRSKELYMKAQQGKEAFKQELFDAASSFDVHAFRSAMKKVTNSGKSVSLTRAEKDLSERYSNNSSLLASGLEKITLKHVESVSEKNADLKLSFEQGTAQKREFLLELQQEVASYQAALFGLAFKKATSIDKTFKFSSWQADLAREYFKGPDAINAGKIHAFRTGDILALIEYAHYLDRYFKSSLAFTSDEWRELLKTVLLLYVRIAQDCHAVAAVNEFIDTTIKGNFPADDRFIAWKKSMNKILRASQDLVYSQKVQEGVMAYLAKLWSPRMNQAIKNDQLVDYESVLSDVVDIMNNIDPANMPNPAVVCCLDGKTALEASKSLEAVFRMFDFSASQARHDGVEIALSQINRCQSWKEFMATILKIEVPSAK